VLIPSLYATSLRTRSLRPVRVPSDHNTRWRLPFHFLPTKDNIFLSPHICQISLHFRFKVGIILFRRDAAPVRQNGNCWKPLHRNHLNFFRKSLLWINVKMISVSGIALKFQNFCMKTTPGQTFLHIASSLNPNWIGGMIKLEGNKKLLVGLAPRFPS
jgi:hypothetical protein